MKTVMMLLMLTKALAASDLSDRTRKCSAQAEKVEKKLQTGPEPLWTKGMRLVQNHYSPKYQRCFAFLEWHGKITSVAPLKNLLIDPFEGRWLASVDADFPNPDGTAFWQCRDDAGHSYGGRNKDGLAPKGCVDVWNFIDERMKD